MRPIRLGIISKVVLISIGILFYLIWHEVRLTYPTSHDFFKFLKLTPASRITSFGHFQLAGKGYIEVVGKVPSVLASGPPVYIFDESGNLIDWIEDNGEHPRFYRQWIESITRTPMTVDQASAIIIADRASRSLRRTVTTQPAAE
jgi:hypothetical protein